MPSSFNILCAAHITVLSFGLVCLKLRLLNHLQSYPKVLWLTDSIQNTTTLCCSYRNSINGGILHFSDGLPAFNRVWPWGYWQAKKKKKKVISHSSRTNIMRFCWQCHLFLFDVVWLSRYCSAPMGMGALSWALTDEILQKFLTEVMNECHKWRHERYRWRWVLQASDLAIWKTVSCCLYTVVPLLVATLNRGHPL